MTRPPQTGKRFEGDSLPAHAKLSARACPRCGGRVRRIHRTQVDRALSKFFVLRRYWCRNAECQWQGAFIGGASVTLVRSSKWLLTLVLVVLGAAVASVCITRFLTDDPPGMEEDY